MPNWLLMAGFRHIVVHFKKYGRKHRFLYFVSFMLLFWSIFDGIISYISPLVLVDEGYSNTMMGIIIASSSVAGAVFDFLLSKFLGSAHYRRLYLILFAICFIYPLVLWQAKTIPIYLIAMAIWGLYYDILHFGNFDFVSREMEPDEHASSFGVINAFKSIGYLIAPIILGFVVTDTLDYKPFVLSWIFLVLAAVFYVVLYFITKRSGLKREKGELTKPISFKKEIAIWKKLGVAFLPMLFFTMILTMQDAVFWTIGPLFSETISGFGIYAGIFMTAYTLPTLIFGWFADIIVEKFGRKNSLYFSFAISSLLLALFVFFDNTLAFIVLIFFSAVFSTITWALEGSVYTNYIDDHRANEKEVEGLGDMSVNFGYILGPILAGFFADKVGYIGAFTVMGIVGVFASMGIYFITDKHRT